jgi:hypothetical protein
MSHVPEPLRDSCATFGAFHDYIAAAECAADDGAIDVTYYLYETAEGLDTAYQDAVAGLGGPSETGSCFDTTAWPAENSYTISSAPAGQVMCQVAPNEEDDDEAQVLWTDTRFLIMAYATEINAGIERVWEFWLNEAGPF